MEELKQPELPTESLTVGDQPAPASTDQKSLDVANIAETASTTFGLNFPRFCMYVDRLSNKSLRRMIKALVGVPLEDLRPNMKNDAEREAFALGHHCFEAKVALFIDALLTQQQSLAKIDEESKLQQETEAAKPAEIKIGE